MDTKDSKNFRQYARRVSRKSALNQAKTAARLLHLRHMCHLEADVTRPWNAKEDARRAKQKGFEHQYCDSTQREFGATIFRAYKRERELLKAAKAIG